MKTITVTVESFAICPAVAGDPAWTIALGLISPGFPRRHGGNCIMVAARGIAQMAGGKINVDVGRGDHRRSFQIRLAQQHQPLLPSLTVAEREMVLSGGAR